METTSTKSFGNTFATDWLEELEDAIGGEMLEQMFLYVKMDSEKTIDCETACCAIAAAEVIATIKGRPCSDLPDEVKEWTSDNVVRETNKLAKMAHESLYLILKSSELKDHWKETDDYQGWIENMKDLVNRVK